MKHLSSMWKSNHLVMKNQNSKTHTCVHKYTPVRFRSITSCHCFNFILINRPSLVIPETMIEKLEVKILNWRTIQKEGKLAITCIINQYINSSPSINCLQISNHEHTTTSVMTSKQPNNFENKHLLTVLSIASTSASFETSPPKVRACPPTASIFKKTEPNGLSLLHKPTGMPYMRILDFNVDFSKTAY